MRATNTPKERMKAILRSGDIFGLVQLSLPRLMGELSLDTYTMKVHNPHFNKDRIRVKYFLTDSSRSTRSGGFSHRTRPKGRVADDQTSISHRAYAKLVRQEKSRLGSHRGRCPPLVPTPRALLSWIRISVSPHPPWRAPLFVGPVLNREIAIAPRRLRIYIARTTYVAGLLLLVFTAWMVLSGSQKRARLGRPARFGTILFQLLPRCSWPGPFFSRRCWRRPQSHRKKTARRCFCSCLPAHE